LLFARRIFAIAITACTSYPGLTVEDIRACVAYARDVLVEVQVQGGRGP
jgi:hypothetical protein